MLFSTLNSISIVIFCLKQKGKIISMKKVYGLLITGITLSFSLSVNAQFTTSGNDIYYNTGNVGIGISAPVQKLDIAGSIKIHYPGKVYFDRVNVKSEQFLATNGQGGGWMFNATYGGSGNPQSNATYSIEPGQHNTSAGYLDFDGNSRSWSINLSAPSTGIGQPVSFKRVAFLDNTEVILSPTGNDYDFSIQSSGNVGIGTASPGQLLDVHGDVEIGGGSADFDGTDEFIHINSKSQDWYIGVRNLTTPSNSDFHIGLTQEQDGIFHIQPDGNIGIGTVSPGNRLEVNGTVRSKEVIVEAINWPDYVFEVDYSLLSLKELEAYISVYKHLPEIPTAKEVEENGQLVGEIQKLLLKKIEELTLYSIELEKARDRQEKINKEQQELNDQLIKRLEILEKSRQ